MTSEQLNELLLEQEESSSTFDDLRDDGDQFEMNLAEKSDVELYETEVEPQGRQELKSISPSENTPNDVMFEQKASSSTPADLVSTGDQFEMNLAEKSDLVLDIKPVEPTQLYDMNNIE